MKLNRNMILAFAAVAGFIYLSRQESGGKSAAGNKAISAPVAFTGASSPTGKMPDAEPSEAAPASDNPEKAKTPVMERLDPGKIPPFVRDMPQNFDDIQESPSGDVRPTNFRGVVNMDSFR